MLKILDFSFSFHFQSRLGKIFLDEIGFFCRVCEYEQEILASLSITIWCFNFLPQILQAAQLVIIETKQCSLNLTGLSDRPFTFSPHLWPERAGRKKNYQILIQN